MRKVARLAEALGLGCATAAALRHSRSTPGRVGEDKRSGQSYRKMIGGHNKGRWGLKQATIFELGGLLIVSALEFCL